MTRSPRCAPAQIVTRLPMVQSAPMTTLASMTAPGPTLDRLDRLEQDGQVEADDILPDDPGGVFRRDEVIEGRGAEDDLVPDGGPEPRDADRGSGRRTDLAIRPGRHLEEGGWRGDGSSGAIGVTPGKTIAPVS